MICTYAKSQWATRVVLQDGVVVIAIALGAYSGGAWGTVLTIGGVVALAWAFATLHFPSRVEVTDEHIAFAAYGRSHEYLWRDVARVRVRRFLVKDRVLVRVTPAGAWRGRYWITDALSGYDALVAELERRAVQT